MVGGSFLYKLREIQVIPHSNNFENVDTLSCHLANYERFFGSNLTSPYQEVLRPNFEGMG